MTPVSLKESSFAQSIETARPTAADEGQRWRPQPELFLLLCLAIELFARVKNILTLQTNWSAGLCIASVGVLWGLASLAAPHSSFVRRAALWSGKAGELLLHRRTGMLLLAVWCMGALWTNAIALNGAIALTDDHSSFQYRLAILQQEFPQLRIYNPGFNAGYIEWTAQVGTPVLYGLLFPFLSLFPVHLVYPYLLAGLLILLPVVMGWSARLFRVSPGVWWAVVLLTPAATATQFFSIRHLLALGMLPYTISSMMAVLFTAALYNIGRQGWRWENSAALFLSCSIGLWHPVFVLLIATPSLFVLFDRETRMAFWSPLAVRLLAAIAALAAFGFLAPWLLNAIDLDMVRRLFAVGEFNDLIFYLLPFWFLAAASVGLFQGWLAGDALRVRLWTLTVIVLTVCLFGGVWFMGGVEPWRFGAPLSLFLVFPAGVYAVALIQTVQRERRGWVWPLILTFGLLLLKQSSEYFSLLEPEPGPTAQIRHYITQRVPEDGRIYVEDFQPIRGGRWAYAETHALGGHLAYLQALTKREIIGEPYHTSGKRIDQPFRITDFTRPEDLQRYFRIYNITHLLLKHPTLIQWCQQFPFLQPVQQIGPFVFFETGQVANRILEGEGTVEAHPNQLIVQTKGDEQPLTLSYHWLKGLRSDPPARIDTVELFPGEFFIRLFPGKETRIVLRYQ